MIPAPAAGIIDGGVHRFPVRVYFEDTDLSGVVYHANWLRFLERARSDLLDRLGIDQRAAHEAGEGAWAVADLSIRYRRPARLGDALWVETRLAALAGACAVMDQAAFGRDGACVEARVRAAFVAPDGRPQRIPRAWHRAFSAFPAPAFG